MSALLSHYDVAIAGGGPAGAAAAIMLARAGWQVLLADARPLASSAAALRIGEGFPPSAKALLTELDVWPQFLADGHRVSHGNVSVWGSDIAQQQDFLHDLHGHGYQLERRSFDTMLQRAAQQAGAQFMPATRLSLAGDAKLGMHTVQLQDVQQQARQNKTITANWLIDATGRNASLARKLGAQRLQCDQLLAFYALLTAPSESEAASDQDGRSMIEAVENGWWYSVLLPAAKPHAHAQRLLAYFSDADLLDKASLLTSTGFSAQLKHTKLLAPLCARHRYQLAGAPLGVSAASACLAQSCGERWLAAGDAALSFDPLSSQGIATAIYSGIQAAHAIQRAQAGDSSALGNYAQLLAKIFHSYLQHRQEFYALEQRWPQQAFWQRRAVRGE